MLTLIKEIFTWWNQQTLGTRINTILFGKIVGEDHFGNNTIKVNQVKDGLYIMEKLKQQKYQMNGIHGCIILVTI